VESPEPSEALPEPASPVPPPSAVLAALERAWTLLRQRYPELPPVVFVLDSTPEPSSLRPCGHWRAERWPLQDGEPSGELRLPLACLQDGAKAVLELLLHEAVHILAHVRGLQETSRQGRYHNRRFRALAEEMGLLVEPDERWGWGKTRLVSRTRRWYAPLLAALNEVLHSYPHAWPLAAPGGLEGPHLPDALEQQGTYGRLLLVCGCSPPRKLRVSRATAARGPITCGLCALSFGPGGPRPAARTPAAPAAPTLGEASWERPYAADEPVEWPHGIVSRGETLPDLARLVCHHAHRCPTDPRTPDRVLIAQLWERLPPEQRGSLPELKHRLVQAHRRGLLQLTRAARGGHDLTPDARRSETHDGPLVFHHLVLPPLPSPLSTSSPYPSSGT
jgi:hypothetical protein